MAVRVLHNIGEPLQHLDNTPLVGVKVTFTLVSATTGKKVLAFSLPENTMVLGEVETITNDIGEFSVTLAANDTITPSTIYKCSIEGLGTFKGVLESGLTPKKLIDFFL